MLWANEQTIDAKGSISRNEKRPLGTLTNLMVGMLTRSRLGSRVEKRND